MKELRENLTLTEKFVLLMLAEYHRTDQKNSWPSSGTLAHDCLMDRRSVLRVVARLEEKQFVVRDIGGGRGKVTAYKIVGLDVLKGDLETVIPGSQFSAETVTETVTVETRNSDPTAHAIRKERVEPVLEPVNTIQSFDGEVEFHELMDLYPKGEYGHEAQVAFVEAVEFIGKRKGLDLPSSVEFLRERVSLYASITADWPDKTFISGAAKWLRQKAFMQDESVWRKGDGKPSKTSQLVERNRQAIANGLGLGSTGRDAGYNRADEEPRVVTRGSKALAGSHG